MGRTITTMDATTAPAIYPSEASFPGMLRLEGRDEPLDLGQFLDLADEDGSTRHGYRVERVIETNEIVFSAFYAGGMLGIFARGYAEAWDTDEDYFENGGNS